MRPLTTLLCVWLSSSALADTSDTPLVETVKKAILEETNEFRQEHNRSPLSVNDDLNAAASKFATFMAENDKYGHRADGRTPAERAKAAGYKYCVVRENIAYRKNTGEVTADKLTEVFVQGWIDSPPHRENLLAEYVTETGVAVATDDQVTYYAVQMFGRPKSAAFKVTVKNHTDRQQIIVLETEDEANEVEIPPGGILKMTRCVPFALSLKDGAQQVKVSEAAELTLTEEGIQRVKNEEEPATSPN